MKFIRQCQRGFITVIAIVLLGLFGLIGVYMSTQFNTVAVSSATSYLGIQAWFAARSGAEWATYQALHAASCPATTNLTVSSYNVTITCSSTAVIEGSDNYIVYDLSSRASRGTAGDIDFVSRTLRTSVTDAP